MSVGQAIDVEKAKRALSGCTCALYHGEELLTSERRGVAPLMDWLNNGRSFQGFSAADKVVGKAAAYLYVLLGVSEVYAVVLSEAAEEVLRRFDIAYAYEERVAAIRNRDSTGFCPMEQAVWDIDEPKRAYEVILETLQKLRG